MIISKVTVANDILSFLYKALFGIQFVMNRQSHEDIVFLEVAAFYLDNEAKIKEQKNQNQV